MKKNLKNLLKDFNNFFAQEPTAKTQSWSLLNDFYHLLLSYMAKEEITQSELAEKAGVSRSAISQLFNRQPNITLNKISEISNSIGLKLKLTSEQIEQPRIEKKVIIKKMAPSFINFKDIASEEMLSEDIEANILPQTESGILIHYNQVP